MRVSGFRAVDQQIRALAKQAREFASNVNDRLDEKITLTVVAALADLPDDAPPQQWFRVIADPTAVYIGNGPGRPLSRFTTTPV